MDAGPLLPEPPTCTAPPRPTQPCPVCPRLAAEFEPRQQAAFWQAMHQRAVQREAALRQENQALRARIRALEQRLFGRAAESHLTRSDDLVGGPATAPPAPRRRGRPPGRPAPRRRDYSHLPAVEETHALPDDQRQCGHCGKPFADFPGTEDSTILEVAVRPHRRVIHRRRYRPTCTCGGHPGVLTAPPPPRVIPKSHLGVSIWVTVLLDKYLSYRPTHRLLADWATHGLDLPPGTVTDGLRRLLPLFEPLRAALLARARQHPLWHADETRWLVYATVEGKVGYCWYLWVFHTAEVVVFVLDRGRARDVPEAQLGPQAEGILVVDRYAAYKALPQVKAGKVVLAFCWAHTRRDFLDTARSWPVLADWGLAWVDRIGQLYAANDARLAVRDDPAAFAGADQTLRQHVAALAAQVATELGAAGLHPACRQTLESVQAHWSGLTVFVDHPDVPLDNNTAERSLRGPVVGRKNYHGSGAEWSGQLAALVFSLLQTLALWKLNPRAWLTAYLQACADAGGQAPPEATGYLPWNLTAEQKQAWSSEAVPINTS